MKNAVVGMAFLVMVFGHAADAVIYQQVAVKDAAVESGDPDASMGDAADSRLYPEFNGGDPEAKGIRPGFFVSVR